MRQERRWGGREAGERRWGGREAGERRWGGGEAGEGRREGGEEGDAAGEGWHEGDEAGERRRHEGREAGGHEGQAAVELALVLPFVALLLLMVVQVALVIRDQVLVVHAAREAARAAAVDPTPGAARRAALAGAPLVGDRLAVDLAEQRKGDRHVRATLSYRSPTVAPLVGPLIPDVVVRAQASMRREHP